MKKSFLLIAVMAVLLFGMGFVFMVHDAYAQSQATPFATIASASQAGAIHVPVELRGTLKGTDAIQSSTEPSEQQGITFIGAVHFKDYATTKEGLGTVFTVTTGDTIISPSSTFLIGAAAETLGHSSAFQIDSAQTSAGQNILYVESTKEPSMWMGMAESYATGSPGGILFMESSTRAWMATIPSL